jgi:YegS/Rv2252/BmrU family lipid kinase
MKSDTFVIVNPVSGRGRALRAEREVADFLAASRRKADFGRSESSEDVRAQAARAAANGYRYVVALGGDGAFHHLIEGLLGTDAVAGFFPAGGGNDIARDLRIPEDPVRAAEAFLHARAKSVDVIRASFRDGQVAHFIGAGGMGLDAQAAHLANTRFRGWPGAMRYVAGALTVFFREEPYELRAALDGVPWRGGVLFAAVANGASYGSGIRIAPDAKMDDGWLNVVLVGEISWAQLFEALPVVLTTGNIRLREVERFRCRRVRLEANRAALVHGDGESLGESPVEFEVLPGAVRVMVPEREI